jgi:hypothetical protein
MWGREDLQKLVAHVMVTAWLRRREGLETELRSSDPLPFGGRHASTGYTIRREACFHGLYSGEWQHRRCSRSLVA